MHEPCTDMSCGACEWPEPNLKSFRPRKQSGRRPSPIDTNSERFPKPEPPTVEEIQESLKSNALFQWWRAEHDI